jgi:tetratricopeptide (TPR) repeat protein
LVRLRKTAYLSFTGSALSYFIIRHIATRSGDTGIHGVQNAVLAGDFDSFNKIRIVLKVFGFYVKKLIIPWPLNFAIIHVSNAYIVIGGIALIACIILLCRRDINSALILLAVSTIVPALLLPLGPLTWTPVAERYLYMSTAPFCIAMSFAAYSNWKHYNHPRVITWCGVVLVVLFAYSTAQRTLIWQTNLNFFEDAVKKTPDFPPLKNELALALEKAGRREEANRIFQNNILPNNAKYSIIADMNRARVSMAQGKPAEARDILLAKNYKQGKPFYVDYLEMLVAVDEKILLQPEFKDRKRLEQEVNDTLISLAEVSGDPLYYYRLGKKSLTLGKREDAAKYFKLAYEKSSANAFYKVSSKKLAEKLSQ